MDNITNSDSSSTMDVVDRALHNERNGYSSFDADYTPSPETIAKVNDVFNFIEANPDKWDQDSYGNHLSETNCFMGILCRINGKTTSRFPWHEDNGDVADDFHDYSLFSAMELIDMYDPETGDYGHTDRAEYIANFLEVPVLFDPEIHERDTYYPYRKPTLDEMRERVSIAMNHDFRKRTLKVGENGPFPQANNEV